MMPTGPDLRSKLPLALFDGYEETLQRMVTFAGSQKMTARRRSRNRIRVELNVNEGSFTFSLISSWAVVAEILAFYQERIAEGAYVGTAIDPSALWRVLAPLKCHPARRSTTEAIFSVIAVQNSKPGNRLIVPAGTTIRAITGSGKPSEIFEVRDSLEVRGDWNEVALKLPSRTADFVVESGSVSLKFSGIGLGIRPGSRLLFLPASVALGVALPPSPLPKAWIPSVVSFAENVGRMTTDVKWIGDVPTGLDSDFGVYLLEAGEPLFGSRAPLWQAVPPEVQITNNGHLGGGVLKASLGGDKWESFNQGVPFVSVGDLPLNSLTVTSEGAIVAGSRKGVMLAKPDSQSWEYSNTGLTSLDVTALASAPDGALFAGTSSGTVFRSTDGAKKWQPVDGELKVVHKAKPRRERDGDTWSIVSTKLPNSVVRALAWIGDEQNGPTLLAATDLGVYHSLPEGGGWHPETEGMLVTPPVKEWMVIVEGSLVLAMAGHELFLRKPGGAWSKVGKVPSESENMTLAMIMSTFSVSLEGGDVITTLPGGSVVRWNGTSWSVEGRAPLRGVGSLVHTPKGETVVVVPSEGITDADWPDSKPIAGQIDLSRVVATVTPGKWIVVEAPGVEPMAFLVKANDTVPRIDLMQNAEVSRLTIPEASLESLARFDYRKTIVLATRRTLAVARIDDALATTRGATMLDLARRIPDVQPGRQVLIVGKRPRVAAPDDGRGGEDAPPNAGPLSELLDLDAVPDGDLVSALPEDEEFSEIAEIASVIPSAPHAGTPCTRLEFRAPLTGIYDLATVRAHLNMIQTTHGKTVDREILGDGDSGEKNQSFVLKQGPLVFVRDSKGDEPVSTLRVWVDGVLWSETDSLATCRPASRCYVLRIDETGQARITFGDGVHGSRVPTGRANVVVAYRVGDPTLGGEASPGLAFWDSKPAGVQGVKYIKTSEPPSPEVNPKDAAARTALTLETMDRAVTVQDVARLALTVSGIADSHAVAVPLAHGTAVLLSLLPERSIKHFDPKGAEHYVRDRKGFSAAVVGLACECVPVYFKARLVVSNENAEGFIGTLAQKLEAFMGYSHWPLNKDLRATDLAGFLQRQSGVLKVDLLALFHTADSQNPVESVRAKPVAEGMERLGTTGVQAIYLEPLSSIVRETSTGEATFVASNMTSNELSG
jgi:hypothetical protein